MGPPYDLKNVPSDPEELPDNWEIFERHRDLPNIMSGRDDVENAHLMVGFASSCWTPEGVFDTEKALRAANELCNYLRRARSEGGPYSTLDAADGMRIMDRTLRGDFLGEARETLMGAAIVRAMVVRRS